MGCVGRVDDDQFDVATQQFLERIDRFDVGICRLRAFLAPFGDSRQLEIGMNGAWNICPDRPKAASPVFIFIAYSVGLFRFV